MGRGYPLILDPRSRRVYQQIHLFAFAAGNGAGGDSGRVPTRGGIYHIGDGARRSVEAHLVNVYELLSY